MTDAPGRLRAPEKREVCTNRRACAVLSGMSLRRRQLLGGLAALPATALTCSATSGEARVAGRGEAGPEAWLSRLPDSAALRDLTLPGTHNSGARYGGSYTECQNTTIAEQLNSGIRFLDIRCRLIDGSFAVHHGATYQHLNFDDVLGACRDFLSAQPSETVLMRLKQEYSEESPEAFRAVFDDYLDARGYRSLFGLDSTLPELGGARGTVVLLGDSDGLPGVRYGDPAVFDVQDDYTKEPEAKFGLVADQFRKAASQPGAFYVNYVSTAALLPVRDNADRLNPRVKDLLSAEGADWDGLGIVPMDFPNEAGMADALLAHQPAPDARPAHRSSEQRGEKPELTAVGADRPPRTAR